MLGRAGPAAERLQQIGGALAGEFHQHLLTLIQKVVEIQQAGDRADEKLSFGVAKRELRAAAAPFWDCAISDSLMRYVYYRCLYRLARDRRAWLSALVAYAKSNFGGR